MDDEKKKLKTERDELERTFKAYQVRGQGSMLRSQFSAIFANFLRKNGVFL
jgi:hypothetical protein